MSGKLVQNRRNDARCHRCVCPFQAGENENKNSAKRIPPSFAPDSDRYWREDDPKLKKRGQQELLSKMIDKENDDWSKGKTVEDIPPNFGSRVITKYAEELSLLAKEMFGSGFLARLDGHYWTPGGSEQPEALVVIGSI